MLLVSVISLSETAAPPRAARLDESTSTRWRSTFQGLDLDKDLVFDALKVMVREGVLVDSGVDAQREQTQFTNDFPLAPPDASDPFFASVSVVVWLCVLAVLAVERPQVRQVVVVAFSCRVPDSYLFPQLNT